MTSNALRPGSPPNPAVSHAFFSHSKESNDRPGGAHIAERKTASKPTIPAMTVNREDRHCLLMKIPSSSSASCASNLFQRTIVAIHDVSCAALNEPLQGFLSVLSLKFA